jgi:hypothetical protein
MAASLAAPEPAVPAYRYSACRGSTGRSLGLA